MDLLLFAQLWLFRLYFSGELIIAETSLVFSDLETEIRVLHVLGTVQGTPLNGIPTRS